MTTPLLLSSRNHNLLFEGVRKNVAGKSLNPYAATIEAAQDAYGMSVCLSRTIDRIRCNDHILPINRVNQTFTADQR